MKEALDQKQILDDKLSIKDFQKEIKSLKKEVLSSVKFKEVKENIDYDKIIERTQNILDELKLGKDGEYQGIAKINEIDLNGNDIDLRNASMQYSAYDVYFMRILDLANKLKVNEDPIKKKYLINLLNGGGTTGEFYEKYLISMGKFNELCKSLDPKSKDYNTEKQNLDKLRLDLFFVYTDILGFMENKSLSPLTLFGGLLSKISSPDFSLKEKYQSIIYDQLDYKKYETED